jgi:hypothetical protein
MEQTTTTAVTAKRPSFLTVLCILTYVGVGLSVILSIVGFMATQALTSMADTMGTMSGVEEMPGMTDAMNAIKYANVTLAISILGAVLCLVGAILMWKQKKNGFYIYVIGQVAPLVTSAVLLGGSAFSGMALFMGAIFPIAFIVMYGLNLKHMTK